MTGAPHQRSGARSAVAREWLRLWSGPTAPRSSRRKTACESLTASFVRVSGAEHRPDGPDEAFVVAGRQGGVVEDRGGLVTGSRCSGHDLNTSATGAPAQGAFASFPDTPTFSATCDTDNPSPITAITA